MTRPHLRRRPHARRGAPSDMRLGSLLPLAVLAGGYAYDEDEDAGTEPALAQVPLVA